MPSPASFDLRALLQETGALLTGHFRLSSGLHSPNYVQCARLLEHPRNAKAIGEALVERIGAMDAHRIVAPALGGMIIGYTVAQALDVPSVFTERKDGEMTLRRGFQIASGERVVIVEDVVTTGKSTRETADVVKRLDGKVVGFASILNRSGLTSPFDAPYQALMRLDFNMYEQFSCPLCSMGIPLDAPGSRFTR